MRNISLIMLIINIIMIAIICVIPIDIKFKCVLIIASMLSMIVYYKQIKINNI